MRPAPLASSGVALFVSVLPAMAQTLPIEMIFPPSRPAADQGFSPSLPHLPTASFHRATPPCDRRSTIPAGHLPAGQCGAGAAR